MVKWGILGPGSIARKNVVSMAGAKNGVCHAVASRSKDKAQAFADDNGIPTAYGSYQELLDSDVDAIYITIPCALRKEWIIKGACGACVIRLRSCIILVGDLMC